MARPLILSNGRMLVGLNEKGLVQDFYFPYVGQSNMTNARLVEHKIGVSIDGQFSWISSNDWEVRYSYEDDALIGHVEYVNNNLGVTLEITSFVDAYDDLFCRSIVVSNVSSSKKSIEVFMHQFFLISANGRADSSLYVPSNHPYIFTYRGNTAFTISANQKNGTPFSQYAVGSYDQQNSRGTFMDAEDSILSGNPIEHGSSDSVFSTKFDLEPQASNSVEYWVCASSKNYHEATKMHRTVAHKGLDEYLKRTRQYWQRWLDLSNEKTKQLNDIDRNKLKLSLMIIKSHIDERGGLLASSDSSIFNYGKDYYSYVWPRDAAYSLTPLINLGYIEEARQYFKYVERTMHPKGYVHQKYQPDGGLGSTWHPMQQHGKPELNIQEDETASTVILFFKFADVCKDKDFVTDIYDNVITKMLNFMAGFINQSTGLPYPSYDLWEEKFLTTTYTSLLVASALEKGAASELDIQNGNKPIWETSARIIRSNLAKLFASDEQYFTKGISAEIKGEYHKDKVVDISTLYALFKYSGYDKGNMAMVGTHKAVMQYIAGQSPSGGVARYKDDAYLLNKPYTGNPWHVCTLWLAQYYNWLDDKEQARSLVDWTYSHCLPNGVMSEQIDPESGLEIGVAPLVWSHAELINTLLDLNSVSK